MTRRSLADTAEVGVGTLIVFIAMVLVAAVAAAVLVNTTGVLQSKAQTTGKEATQDVASNLKVVNVYGVRAAPTDATLWDIDVQVGLSAGSVPVDLTEVLVRWSDGSTVRTYSYDSAALANGAAASPNFAITWIRDNGATSELDSGDLAQIHFNNAALAPRTQIDLTLRPSAGSLVDAGFRSVPTYGSDLTVTLR